MKQARTLESHGVKPSAQRLAIFSNLHARRDHPTADEVWAALSPAMPTLSRTTVYAALRLFCEKGLSRLILSGGGEMRFDADTASHAHFLCNACGKVIDIATPAPDAQKFPLPRGAKIFAVETYLTGHCPACARVLY